MKDIPLDKVPVFEKLLLENLAAGDTLEKIRTEGINASTESAIQSAAAAVCSSILNS